MNPYLILTPSHRLEFSSEADLYAPREPVMARGPVEVGIWRADFGYATTRVRFPGELDIARMAPTLVGLAALILNIDPRRHQ